MALRDGDSSVEFIVLAWGEEGSWPFMHGQHSVTDKPLAAWTTSRQEGLKGQHRLPCGCRERRVGLIEGRKAAGSAERKAGQRDKQAPLRRLAEQERHSLSVTTLLWRGLIIDSDFTMLPASVVTAGTGRHLVRLWWQPPPNMAACIDCWFPGCYICWVTVDESWAWEQVAGISDERSLCTRVFTSAQV